MYDGGESLSFTNKNFVYSKNNTVNLFYEASNPLNKGSFWLNYYKGKSYKSDLNYFSPEVNTF